MRSHLVQITSKITALAKSGSISCARNLFDEMPHRDTIAWNAMITGYSHLGSHQEALSLFTSMRFSNAKPDHFTCTAVLSSCGGLKDLKFGQRVHTIVIVSGYNSLLPVNNALTDMYGKCLRAQDACKVFEEMGCRNEVSWCSLLFAYSNVGLLDISSNVFYNMPKRVVIAWNTIISGYAKWGETESCLYMFKKMLEDSCGPDRWTLSATMNACAEMSKPYYGYTMHGFIIRSGLNLAVEVNNSVLSFYVKFGDENEVLKAVEAFRAFNEVSWNVIIDAYMKIGNLEEAYRVFQRVPDKNLISWTSMITGYMRNGLGERALVFFVGLTRNYIRPDDITLGAVLHACSNMATLGHGQMVHAYVVQSGFHAYSYVGNSLVNMYAKCGDIYNANQAFNDVVNKDLISWNTMLFAFGLHGRSTQALRIFEEMLASGVKPDKVTFVGLLMMCSHLGIISMGLDFFESMGSRYGLTPDTDHVTCVVDMLARAGKFEKAKELADKYAELDNLDASLSEAVVGSYFSHRGDLKKGAELAEQLRILRPRDEMSYVVLSNLYCASGQWGRAEGLREAMADRGVKKMTGCSWVEVRNEVRGFVAGSKSFDCVEEVYMMLSILESEIRYGVT
ncbi:pentatricopeptide repeat-containing protein at2g36980 mitochondrial [Phtheirospermum japonicum]|uniref:Pentatricopeptide repeat-containing protein at2g36980 mitochondrial n=1 Tax=Phtheirospermum japonicum TaxID=374723 RepID=A0A830B7T9_9LAMI|nr:pentatricopeptide repeat-containing protein at2g36980 mitochondrial [Phtheirospermum japonicum]